MSYNQPLSSPVQHYSDVFSLDEPLSSNGTPTIESSQPDNQWDRLVKIQGLNVLKWTPSKADLFNDWWHHQTWYKEQPNMFLSTDKQINWGSTTRTLLS